jgi:hypothetical protein
MIEINKSFEQYCKIVENIEFHNIIKRLCEKYPDTDIVSLGLILGLLVDTSQEISSKTKISYSKDWTITVPVFVESNDSFCIPSFCAPRMKQMTLIDIEIMCVKMHKLLHSWTVPTMTY